jgi:hypothetical protein
VRSLKLVSKLWQFREATCGQLTLKRYCSSTSDSSLVTPWMRRVKPLLTKTPFHPVTAGLGQLSLSETALQDTNDLFGSLGEQLLAQSRGSEVILEELSLAGCPVLLPLRGRISRRGWRSRSPGRQPSKATSGRRSRTSMSRATRCQQIVLRTTFSSGILTVSPPVLGSVWIFNIA